MILAEKIQDRATQKSQAPVCKEKNFQDQSNLPPYKSNGRSLNLASTIKHELLYKYVAGNFSLIDEQLCWLSYNKSVWYSLILCFWLFIFMQFYTFYSFRIKHHKQEVIPFPAGDHKRAMNRRESMINTRHT